MQDVVTLANGEVRATIASIGGSIVDLRIASETVPVVLSLADLEAYRANPAYLGVTAGRYANRIADGRFTIDGQQFQLDCNEGRNHLHGGPDGLSKRAWRIAAASDTSARFEFESADGDQGYPGTLSVSVDYRLTPDGIAIEFTARSDRATIVNLTNHNYYNLALAEGGAAVDQELTIFGDAYLPIDAELIPTGAVAPVDETPFDFRVSRRIADGIDPDHPQLQIAGGFDHNYLIAGEAGAMRRMARLADPASGRALEIRGDAPGLQFYSGQYLDTVDRGDGTSFARFQGLCLEPQNYPDAPNRPGFPSAVLRPGETYSNRIELHFSTGAAS